MIHRLRNRQMTDRHETDRQTDKDTDRQGHRQTQEQISKLTRQTGKLR